MSKSSKSSSEITSLKATLAEREAQLAESNAKIAELTAAAAAAPAKRAKKERAPADPSKPRMQNAYIVFSSAKRAEMKAANPGAKVTDIAKLLGAEWSKLSPEEKAKYSGVPAVPKEPKPEKPKRVKKTAEAAPAEGDATPAKKAKKQKDPDAPKKPLTSFMLYSQQERAKTPDEKIKSSVLAERWALLTAEEKAAYKSS
uniref:HMG box domain-containing protein n=1 Tax=viral metagenome TaxID=1070528 RepID=A0A6C0LLC2_9ZZZZ